MKRLLLISNSRSYRKRYLEHARDAIEEFLGPQVARVLFVPFASAKSDFDEYTAFVGVHFQEMGYELDGIHRATDPQEAVRQAQAIAIAGGNTFHLLYKLYELDLLDVVQQRVEAGLPYVGWSAGANVACPSLKTTNDMTLTATRILLSAWDKGVAKGLAHEDSIFNEAIEKKWVEQWLFYANSTRFSSAMAGADYGVFANGRWYMSKNIQEMFDWLQLKLADKE